MRFTVKVVPLALLGCAAALLVACGDGNGLLSGSQGGSLQDALAAVESACASGDVGRAELAAQRFSDRVVALPSGEVDRGLIADLQDGAAQLQALVTDTCTGTTGTTTTPTVTTTTTPTPTETTPTTTTPTETTPTTPTMPTETTPTTPPSDTGGGATPPGDSGGAQGPGASLPPGLAKKARGKDDAD